MGCGSISLYDYLGSLEFLIRRIGNTHRHSMMALTPKNQSYPCNCDEKEAPKYISTRLAHQVLFSMTRALSTTPVLLSCSLSGNASTFHTPRAFFFGRCGSPRNLRSI